MKKMKIISTKKIKKIPKNIYPHKKSLKIFA